MKTYGLFLSGIKPALADFRVKPKLRRISLVLLLLAFHNTMVARADALSLTEVAKGIYLYEGVHELMSVKNMGAIANSGFIVGDKSVAVIDPGGSPAFGALLRQAISTVTELPVDYVILTHFHPDHVAGAAAFTDARHIVAHANHARAMTQRAQFYLNRFSEIFSGNVQRVFMRPTREVSAQQQLSVDLGGRVLTLQAHVVAHTDNDLTVFDEKTRTLWVSDLVFAQRTPSLDGSLSGWLDVLSELAEHDVELTIPGHGRPATWEKLVAPQRAYLGKLRKEVKAMIEEGLSLAQVIERHDAKPSSAKSGWALYTPQHGSNLAKAYAELEWE